MIEGKPILIIAGGRDFGKMALTAAYMKALEGVDTILVIGSDGKRDPFPAPDPKVLEEVIIKLKPPALGVINYEKLLPEPKNYITGKKLPTKRKK